MWEDWDGYLTGSGNWRKAKRKNIFKFQDGGQKKYRSNFKISLTALNLRLLAIPPPPNKGTREKNSCCRPPAPLHKPKLCLYTILKKENSCDKKNQTRKVCIM